MKITFLSLIALFTLSTNAQSTVTIGSGTGYGNSLPIATYYNSSGSESIYTGTEIGTTGTISKIGYQKVSGSSTTAPAVKIYMKMTNAANAGTTAYSIGATEFSNYTLVYDGTIPNGSASGTMEITLSTPFSYNDTSKNLAVLMIGQTCIASGRPQYRYTTTSSRMTGSFNDGSIGCDGNNPWTSSSSMTPVLERTNLVVTFSTLSTGEFSDVKSDIIAYIKNSQLELSSEKNTISEVVLFDLTGRKLLETKNNSNAISLPLNFQNQVIIAKIKTADNVIITKKIIF